MRDWKEQKRISKLLTCQLVQLNRVIDDLILVFFRNSVSDACIIDA